MGASLSNKTRSRGRRTGGTYRPMAEINVTPFVDVMLVLLIVFMVAAPLLTAGVSVDLPKSDAQEIRVEDSKPIEVSINNKGEIFMGDTKVSKEKLISVLAAMTDGDAERRIYIRGDQTISYGQIMKIIGMINKAGFNKVALISDPS